MKNSTSQRNLVLQGYRGISALMVFLFHTGLSKSGGYFVTLFIVMSGYFASIGYSQNQFSLSSSFHYGIKRVKKYYGMHIIAFIMVIPLVIDTYAMYSMRDRVLSLLSYNLFLQSFFPKSEIFFAYNSVEWTMSVLIFCFFCTPLLMKIVEKLQNRNKCLLLLMCCIYLVEITYILLFRNSINSTWWCGVFPAFRLCDYFIGCILGKILTNQSYLNINSHCSTTFEFAVLGLWIIVCGGGLI